MGLWAVMSMGTWDSILLGSPEEPGTMHLRIISLGRGSCNSRLLWGGWLLAALSPRPLACCEHRLSS